MDLKEKTPGTTCSGSCSCSGSSSILPESILKYIEECSKRPHAESYLIPVLHKIQTHFGYLSPQYLEEVAQIMRIPAAKISGVATFYHLFSFTPRGKTRIAVCLGTACYVKGSGKILDRFKEVLQLKEGQTSADGLFSIECSRCFGACALAPVVVVNEKVYGEVKTNEVDKILADYGFKK